MAAILRLRGPPHIGRSGRPGAPDALPPDAGRLSAVEMRVRRRTMSIESQLPAGLQTPVDERLQGRRGRTGRPPYLGSRRHPVGARGDPGADRPARLAGHRRAAVGRGRRPARVRAPRCATPASPTPCCSAWAARASGPRSSAARSATAAIRLHVLDSTHPDEIRAVRDALDLGTTLFIVSSKSGGTIETMSQFKYFHSLQGDGSHYVAVTDPGTSLAKLGAEHGFRRVFENDPDIGGRYSVLSYFGLVPAAIAGYDVGAVLRHRAARRWRTAGASRTTPAWSSAPRSASSRCAAATSSPSSSTSRSSRSGCGPSSSSPSRPARRAAASCRSPTSRSCRPPSTATTACSCTSPRATSRSRGKVGELSAAGHPVFTIDADGPADLGRVFFLLGVRHRGGRLGARDQPVRPAQRPGGQGQHQARARRRLARARGRRPRRAAGRARAAALSGDHGLPAVLERGRGRRRAPARARRPPSTTSRPPSATAPASCTRPASSTRAGRRSARSCRSSTSRRRTSRSPERPYTFGTLIRAQADGDLQTLRSHGLDAVRAGREIL